MEKVFAGKDLDREKFDLAQFRDDGNSRKSSKFGDQAYECKYASRNFPLTFQLEQNRWQPEDIFWLKMKLASCLRLNSANILLA